MKKLLTVTNVIGWVLFIPALLLYLWIIVLPFAACHSERLRALIQLDSLFCRGEAYDVGKELVIVFGLFLIGFIILLGLVILIRKN